ncbi:DUF4383 domain-containing protein [Saccharopolyspora sp. CA-218241]|uniref:DUF4383 domain-containing protein n=1 Tax=Saccharopolyspora sp. CA-218241 TaxID=3240027 RepID=UPI003D9831CF
MARTQTHPVHVVHRIGAAALGVALLVFGVLGLARNVPWLFAGELVWGLSTNGALAVLSIVAGLVLVISSVWGGRLASTVSIGLGVLFLLSGLVHLGIMHTGANVLGFRLSNCLFSLIAGLFLSVLGFYGRVSGGLPPDNPYRREHPIKHHRPDPDEQIRAESGDEQHQRMMDAEISVAEGTATREQAEAVERERARKLEQDRKHRSTR